MILWGPPRITEGRTENCALAANDPDEFDNYLEAHRLMALIYLEGSLPEEPPPTPKVRYILQNLIGNFRDLLIHYSRDEIINQVSHALWFELENKTMFISTKFATWKVIHGADAYCQRINLRILHNKFVHDSLPQTDIYRNILASIMNTLPKEVIKKRKKATFSRPPPMPSVPEILQPVILDNRHGLPPAYIPFLQTSESEEFLRWLLVHQLLATVLADRPVPKEPSGHTIILTYTRYMLENLFIQSLRNAEAEGIKIPKPVNLKFTDRTIQFSSTLISWPLYHKTRDWLNATEIHLPAPAVLPEASVILESDVAHKLNGLRTSNPVEDPKHSCSALLPRKNIVPQQSQQHNLADEHTHISEATVARGLSPADLADGRGSPRIAPDNTLPNIVLDETPINGKLEQLTPSTEQLADIRITNDRWPTAATLPALLPNDSQSHSHDDALGTFNLSSTNRTTGPGAPGPGALTFGSLSPCRRKISHDGPPAPSVPSERNSPNRDLNYGHHSPNRTPALHSQPPTPSRYPPFVADLGPGWPAHIRNINMRVSTPVLAHPFGLQLKISPANRQDSIQVQEYLLEAAKRDATIKWHNYTPKSDRAVKVAIRGIPHNTRPEDIAQDLNNQDFVVEHCRPIKARKGRPGCIFLAIIRRSEDTLSRIYKITNILGMTSIKIDAWRERKGLAQCHKCQSFQHSSVNCHRRITCVRCGDEHFARDCPRPRDAPATCANCAGTHPASSPACPIRRQAASKPRRSHAGVYINAPSTTTEMNAPGSLMAIANRPRTLHRGATRGEPTSRRSRKNKRRKAKTTHPAAAGGVAAASMVAAEKTGTIGATDVDGAADVAATPPGPAGVQEVPSTLPEESPYKTDSPLPNAIQETPPLALHHGRPTEDAPQSHGLLFSIWTLIRDGLETYRQGLPNTSSLATLLSFLPFADAMIQQWLMSA